MNAIKWTCLFLASLLCSSASVAATKCFIAKENNEILQKEGDCALRRSPCSTFKVAIALMGYNEKLLIDETHPEFPYDEKYQAWLPQCQSAHNPSTWIRDSCIWYSQELTKKMGMSTFQHYVSDFHYGNQDLSGDPGQNNGLTNAWLGSSLKISPIEQLSFLDHLTHSTLPVTQHAQEMTRHILFVEKWADGTKLYGKTGSGFLTNPDGSLNKDRGMGWFVGWAEKGNKKIIFAHYIEDEKKEDTFAGARAKEAAKQKLLDLVKAHPL